MNKLSLTLGITISITALLLILNTTPNVAKAYSRQAALLPLGESWVVKCQWHFWELCRVPAFSSSNTRGIGGNSGSGSPPNANDGASINSPGASDSVSIGGDQSSPRRLLSES